MRNLRAIYNRAVEEGLTGQRNPSSMSIREWTRRVKRAVPLKVIRRIREADPTQTPAMDYARDLFLFSFYTRGMSFVDMAYLKKKDLQNGGTFLPSPEDRATAFHQMGETDGEIIDNMIPPARPICRRLSRI